MWVFQTKVLEKQVERTFETETNIHIYIFYIFSIIYAHSVGGNFKQVLL